MTRDLTRITYVEDDPDIREVAQLALEHVGGFTLSMCESGPEALEKTPAFNPDMVLLDVMMPGMDGVQTFQSLQALPNMAGTICVFVTAKAQKHEIERYRSLGAVDVIAKPFDPITLADDVRAIWRRTQTAQGRP